MNEKNNQIQGNLIKWKEGQKIGAGTSGEVYTAINIKTWSMFAVKKLQVVSMNSGIDKDALIRLKVSSWIVLIGGLERDCYLQETGA